MNEFRKFIHQTIAFKRDDSSSHHRDDGGHPLILQEILNPALTTIKQYRHRSMECLVDTNNRCVYLDRNEKILDFIALVRASGWVARPLDESVQDHLTSKFQQCVSFESVVFGLSGAECLNTSKINKDQYFKLKFWPELIPETISSPQLLAIARLHASLWKPQNLADISHLSLTTTLGLLTAALECNMLIVDKKHPVIEKVSPVHHETGFLVWVARRFGLRT